MMVGAVHQGHARTGMPEMFAKKQAAKARAQHHDVNFLSAIHRSNFE